MIRFLDEIQTLLLRPTRPKRRALRREADFHRFPKKKNLTLRADFARYGISFPLHPIHIQVLVSRNESVLRGPSPPCTILNMCQQIRPDVP